MKRKLLFVSVILIVCVLAAACNGAAPIGEKIGRSDGGGDYINEVADDVTATGEKSENQIKDIKTRKLIKDSELEIETKEFDKFISNLEKEINRLGGYIQKSDISGSTDYGANRYALIVARIPADKLDDFTNQVSTLAAVKSKKESVRDVTMDYVDIESRIRALKAEEESLLALLKKAERLDDILSIQKALTDVRYQLESYESKIRTYDDLIEYSTVTMEIQEVERETPTKNIGLWQEIGGNLSENIEAIGKAARSFFIWFVSSLPYFVIIAAIAVIILLIVRLSIRCSKKRRIAVIKTMTDTPAQTDTGGPKNDQ